MAERRRVWVIAGCMMVAATVIFWNPPQPPEVVFLDVGHGDCAFIRSPAGKTALIDGGDLSKFGDTGRKVVLPFLRSNHVGSLDCVMVSHPDSDHIGGLLSIVGEIPVKAVVLGATQSDRPLERELIDLCGKKGVPVQRLGLGQEFNLGGMKFTVLHPPVTDAVVTDDVNDQSLVVRLDWGGHRFLFAGDIERVAEQMVESTDCAAEVLKVPHHGSRTSSSPGFVRAVHPTYAVISTGGDTGREPVNEAILARYRAEGIEVLRTDLCGGITVRAGGGNLVFQPTRPMPMPNPTAPRPSVLVGQN